MNLANFHFCVIFLFTSCISWELFLRISFRPFACAHLTSNFHTVFFSTLWILMLNISSKLNCGKCHAAIWKMSKFLAIHPQSLCVGVKIGLLHQIWTFFDSHNMKFLNWWLCGEDPTCITNGWILRSEQDLHETTCPNRLQWKHLILAVCEFNSDDLQRRNKHKYSLCQLDIMCNDWEKKSS